jgi:hypothetical protein
MNDEFVDVAENVELLLFELRTLRAGRSRFCITHRFKVPGVDCAPGEEVAAVNLMCRGKEFPLRLGEALILLFDYLARHSHLAQTASQIVAGMRVDPFYQRHATNAVPHAPQSRKISRSSMKVYIERLRAALGRTFREAQIPLDPYAVLVSEETSSNQVGYRIKATFEWLHIERPNEHENRWSIG